MKKITIIGAGAVGRSLAFALHVNGNTPVGIFSLHGASAVRLAKQVKSTMYGTFNRGIPFSSIVIIAVADSEIGAVVSELNREHRSLKGFTFLHTSGGLTSDELLPLKKRGASIASFHPLQSFSSVHRSTKFKDIYCSVEGDTAAVRTGKALARTIGAKSFVLRKNDKVLYHIAAVFASNYLVTILSVAEQLAKEIDLPTKLFQKIIRPLVIQTAENVLHSSPAQALTGPIVRGDGVTVTRHIRTLETTKNLKHLLPLYAALGIETAHLAKRRK